MLAISWGKEHKEMKTAEPPETSRAEAAWRSFEVLDAFPSASGAEIVPRPRVESDSLSNSLPHNDHTRFFLHQLSQTLTSLRGILELALLVDSDAQEYRRVIQQSLAQAEGLVQLFKSYRALAEADTSDLANAEVGLGELVRVVLEQLRPLADSRRLTVHMESGDNCVVQTDPARLLVALRRGLLCAIQQSPPGGKLEVSISSNASSACLALAAKRQSAESVSQPGLAKTPAHESTKESASDIGEGDWTSARRAVEMLGGNILTLTTEASPLICEICIPLSSPEKV
jgi:light-regulated signal transduction histidine kinase (bacteriophytochrome)